MVTTVPNQDLLQGWNDYTADADFTYDRWGQPQNVRIEDPTTGQWRALQPGETVPAGARFSVYTSQSGALAGAPGPAAGGQETVTGQDLVMQNHRIAMDLVNAQNSIRALDQIDQQIQQSHQQFMADLQQQRDIAKMEAQQNAAQIGVQAAQQQLQARLAELDNEAQAAQLNFNQRLSRVQEERAAARLNLDRSIARSEQLLGAADLNFQQRESLANLQQKGLQMLADRSGPQDWTRYQYLAEEMLSPDAEGSTQVNPFKMLQDFYQPYEPDLQGLEEEYRPDLGGLVQEYTPGSTGGQWQSTLQNAIGQAQAAGGLLGGTPQVQAPTSTRMGGNDPYPQGGQVPGGGGQQPAPGTQTPGGGPQDYGWMPNVPGIGQQPMGPGVAQNPPDVVNPTFDADGGMLQGNDWGFGPPPGGANTQSPVQPPDNPFGTISYGNDNRAFTTGSTFPGRIEPGDMAKYGSGNTFPGTVTPEDMTRYEDRSQQMTDTQRRLMEQYRARTRQMNRGGNLLQGQMAIVGDKPNGRTGYEEAIVNTPQGVRVFDRHQTKGLLEDNRGMKRMATGGLLQSQDVGSADPDAFTFNTYSDEALYNQPFLQQVRGERQGRGFGAFGGGNRVGPFDLPTTPSLGTLSSLSPSALKMTQGAYEDPRTGQYWEDILDRARRASIGTQSMGGMSAFAGYR